MNSKRLSDFKCNISNEVFLVSASAASCHQSYNEDKY